VSELIVVGFDDAHEADRALNELARLQTEYLIDLEDAVVAVRDPDGRLRLKQSVDLVGAGRSRDRRARPRTRARTDLRARPRAGKEAPRRMVRLSGAP